MEYLKEIGWIELMWFPTVISKYGKHSNNMSHHYKVITDEQKRLVRKWYISHGVYKTIKEI
jgi:hypothetical protein